MSLAAERQKNRGFTISQRPVPPNGFRALSFTIPMGILVGDTNANATVNAADVAQTKGRLGQTVGASTFRSDLSGNGSISATHTAIVKQHSGTSLP